LEESGEIPRGTAFARKEQKPTDIRAQ